MSAKNSSLWPHTGAILCGGQSRRMKQHKAGVILPDGTTLIENVYLAMKEVCRDAVLVGHGQGIPDSMSLLRRIDDHHVDCGPLGGLEALLSSGIDECYLILPCDLMNVTSEILRLVVDEQEISKPVILKRKDFIEPLVGCYPASTLTLVRDHIQKGDFAMHSFADAAGAKVIEVSPHFDEMLKNVNTVDDLQ